MKRQLNIRGKNLLWIALVLIVSIAMVGAAIWSKAMVPVSADDHPAQAIWADPGNYTTAPELDTLEYCDSFTVSIMVNITAPTPGGGTGLYGWEYVLHWNAAELSLTSHVEPDLTDPAGLNWASGFWVKKNTSPAPGYFANESVWCSATAFAPDPAFTGVTWLSNYTFHVEMDVFEPDPARVGHILMDGPGLTDDKVEDIITPFTDKKVVSFRICPKVIPTEPELEVKPAEVHGVCGEKFNITIWIKYLDAAWNMCRWNATLSYNTTMLDAQASFEGPFLDGFDNANYTGVINDPVGTVYTTGFFVSPPATPPNGTGVLAIIEFNATWQYTVSPTMIPPITSSLSLYNTTLVDCASANINHTVVAPAPTYTAPYKPEVIDHAIDFAGQTYHVFTESNSSFSPVIFKPVNKSLSFNVAGTSGYYGFCKITIPTNFLKANPPTEPWTVMVNGAPLSPTITSNATHTVLYFKFEFPSTILVWVEGTWLVPEFPIAMILPLLFIATLTAAVFGKRVRSGKRRGSSVAE